MAFELWARSPGWSAKSALVGVRRAARALRELGMRPIVGLLPHASGPRDTRRASLRFRERRRVGGCRDDCPTPDGTCVLDYVHVADLARSHDPALDYLADHPGAHRLNLGSGRAFSVLEMIATASNVTGEVITPISSECRPGDPLVLVVSSGTARRELGWSPVHLRLQSIIENASGTRRSASDACA